MSDINTASQQLFVEIILPINIKNTLTYGVPFELIHEVALGKRVEVALKGNKFYSGIIADIHHDKPDFYEVKPIRNVLDHKPILNEVQLRFWKWVAQYYMAELGEVMFTALPSHLKLESETKLEWIDSARNEMFHQDFPQFSDVILFLQQKKIVTINELKQAYKQLPISNVIGFLIDYELVFVSDGLEPSYKPKTEKVILLSKTYEEDDALHKAFDLVQKAAKQQHVLMTFLQLLKNNNQPIIKQQLIRTANASLTHVKALIEKGILEEIEVTTDRLGWHKNEKPTAEILSDAQQIALNDIHEKWLQHEVCVLRGVTGSGKTAIYVKLIKTYIERKKQVVFLLPEIAITTQLVQRLKYFFGEELGVYHSRYTQNERVEIWERVRNQSYKIILGTRSSVWLPFSDLGLIIVDEEHDVSYKQNELNPRFHARDASIYLASLYGAKVLLGSATPSIETLHNVQLDKYGLVNLLERYNQQKLPDIEVVSLKSTKQLKHLGVHLITPELLYEMTLTLEKGNQIILFQNKRGYTPYVLCRTCGWVPQCNNCSVSLTYHKSTDKLHCHYCGQKTSKIHNCISCGSTDMTSKTFGTQKVEEEVKLLFPNAKVARMDTDATKGKNQFSELLEKLANQQIDILVGTQMVTKGLDIKNVALVGILNADNLLHFPDFRVHERAFQMIEQVSGRAGRSNKTGKVIIQTYDMQHKVLQYVLQHDLKGLYLDEIDSRKAFGFPPFTRLIKIIFKQIDESIVQQAAALYFSQFTEEDHEIYGISAPNSAPISKIRNQYIYEIWIKCKNNSEVLNQLKDKLWNIKGVLKTSKGMAKVQVVFDVDPA
jgi:primosomal protein N' (replication factor Y)